MTTIASLVDPANYVLNPYAVPPFVTALAIVLLGWTVLLRERLTSIALSFLVLTSMVGMWLFTFAVAYCAIDPNVAGWWVRTAYVGIPFIAPGTYQFTMAVLRITRRHRRIIGTNWALGVLFATLALATNSLVAGVYHYWWGYYPRFDWAGVPFIAWFVVVFLSSMGHYWYAIRHAQPGTHYRRIRAFMLAFAFGYLGCVDFVPVYGLPLYPFGYLAILGFIVLTTYTIWVYRLVDITPAFAASGIIDTMTDALIVLDREGIVRLVNPTARELMAHRGEVTGKAIETLLDNPEFSDQFKQVLAGNELRNYEVTIPDGPDSSRTLSVSASVMRDARAQPLAVVCIARDITESKQAQADISTLFDALLHSHQELALAYDTTLEGWARALDLRDHETEGHSRRVTMMAERLARIMGMNEDEIRHLRQGALLHDIGKMGIPDSILLKPGSLTEEEWAIMRCHPIYAYELLAPIAFLRPALDIPYCHHEKWDGTGYPRGLRGEQIPFAARIFAVVDVWDALSSNRPYRPAWPAGQILEHIRALAGSHFDPVVVEAFLGLEEFAPAPVSHPWDALPQNSASQILEASA